MSRPERAAAVRAMFGRIAGRYDLMNTLMTGGQDRTWRAAAVAAARSPSDGLALDVGTGTARLALALAEQMPRGRVVGADFAEPMLRQGQADLARSRVGMRVSLVLADALALPFGDACFDRVTTAFTVRNVVDVVAAFREMRRVLRPGGRVVCLEITRPRRPLLGPVFHFHFRRLVPLIGRLVSGDAAAYRYLPSSAYAFLDAPRLAGAMRQAGLEGVRYRYLGMGSVALHVGIRPYERGDGMAELLIRQARPEDGPVVRDFVFATLRAYDITPDPEGLDADVVAFGSAGDGPVRELVAELDGRVVGSAVVSARGNDEAGLSKLFVDASARGRGIGRALLERAEAEARAQGYRRLWLETRTLYREAVRLYESQGWKRGPDLPPGHGPDRSYYLDL